MYKTNAKNRGYEWLISDEDFYRLLSQNCHYCGLAPSTVSVTNKNGTFTYNGLDRRDNSLGYILSNLEPCCANCNRAKGAMSVDQFRAWIARVYHHFVVGQSVDQAAR